MTLDTSSELIAGNQSGGSWLQENSEISFWFGGYPNVIHSNGPVGVLLGFGSQATFFNSAKLPVIAAPEWTSTPNGQAYFSGANLVQSNGSSGHSRSAGIRVDGNSEAFLRGGEVSQNVGPGVLALINSSADFSGVTFSGNTGITTCDSNSTMISDLAGPNITLPAGVSCRTPHGLGARHLDKSQPATPNWSAQKAQHDRYAKLAVKH